MSDNFKEYFTSDILYRGSYTGCHLIYNIFTELSFYIEDLTGVVINILKNTLRVFIL